MADQIKSFLSHIDTKTSGNQLLGHFESNTGLPRSYGVIIGSTVYLFLVFLNVGGIGQLLSNIVGFAIPGYYSLHALETSSTQDDTDLLTYWVVFAFLNVIEFWSKAILYWIPFYWLFKTIFLLYLSVPGTGGARNIYLNLIKPIAQKHVAPRSAPSFDLAEEISEAADGVSTSVEL